MNEKNKSKSTQSSENMPSPMERVPSKTPVYSAMHAARYHRQNLIRNLEHKTGRKLLCFVSGHSAEVSRDDTAPFIDLLHNLTAGEPVDLLLHTPGGDIDAAEKLITLLRAIVGEEGSLRVIVPEFAKSAGTLMALGANAIVMSDSSELGTIDPQVYLSDGHGNEISHSVLSYIAAYHSWSVELRKTPADPVAKGMMDKFDPTVLYKFEAVARRARSFAENLLMRRGLNFSKVANDLMDIDQFPSHNQMIGWETAEKIGLNIEYLPGNNTAWQLYWELYCLLRLAVKDNQKIFESARASLIFDT